MACIEIKGPDDQCKMIPENSPYPAGWSFTGKIEWACGPNQGGFRASTPITFRKCSNCGEMGVYEST